jgi:hypothetical protein
MTLDELIELEKRATPGPWSEFVYKDEHGLMATAPYHRTAGNKAAYEYGLADSHLLTILRNLAPELLALWKAANDQAYGHDSPIEGISFSNYKIYKVLDALNSKAKAISEGS